MKKMLSMGIHHCSSTSGMPVHKGHFSQAKVRITGQQFPMRVSRGSETHLLT